VKGTEDRKRKGAKKGKMRGKKEGWKGGQKRRGEEKEVTPSSFRLTYLRLFIQVHTTILFGESR